MTFSNKNLADASSPDNFSIDRAQATTQLEALGFKRGDAIYVRAFLPKEDPRYAPNTGRKVDKLNWKQIEDWQAQGYGIYIVVNGGGHKDADVKRCRAIFIEHDDLEIELQRHLWKTLELPEPTFQVQTRKSVHSYWVIEGGCDVEEWKPLQTDLLAYTNADPVIKNPSRVMRLAGAYHIKPGCEPLRCEIIHNSGKKYSYSQLRASVPVPVASIPAASLPLPSVAPQKNQSVAPLIQRYEDIQIPVTESVPLENCLAKESRKLLESGVSEGSRNVGGAKLARDLIGTANHLQSIGQRFDGNPRQLLEDYSNRCTPPLLTKEVEGIWKSAEKDRPTPSCHPSAIESCIRAWYWKEYVKPLQQKPKHHTQKPDSFTPDRNTTPIRPAIESVTLRERIAEIIERNLSAADFTAALVELSTATGRQLREITELAAAVEVDLEIEDTRGDRAVEINRLQQIKQRSLTLDKYLPASLAEPMTRVANWMGAPPAAFLVALLPTIASLLDPATRVIVKECIGFIEHPIIYAGIVTESGQRKSPILNAITDALRTLQQEEDARYQKLKADYDTAKAKWDALSADAKFGIEAPVTPRLPREYYIDKATMEAVDTIKQNQPTSGILWLKDELSGLMASYGAYKNGRGGDKESMLSGWNGRGVKKNLKGGERISLPCDAMSVLGAIQDAKLQQMMGDFNDDQGDWARFIWLLIPLQGLKLPEDDTTFQLVILESLYRQVACLASQTYRFSADAQRLYDNFHWRLEQRRVSEPKRGMRAAIAKMEGYTARLALLLHIIWELVAGKEIPDLTIPRERVTAAMKLTEFFLGQVELIHTEGAAANSNELTPRLTAILDKAKQFGELTARKVQSAVSWLRNVNAAKIRHDFLELAKLGYGVCVGNGNRLKFIPQTAATADKSADVIADSSNEAESIADKSFFDLKATSADPADSNQLLKAPRQSDEGSHSKSEKADDQHQHISSNGSNSAAPDITANNELSAHSSAVAADLLDSQPQINNNNDEVVTEVDSGVGSKLPPSLNLIIHDEAVENTLLSNQPKLVDIESEVGVREVSLDTDAARSTPSSAKKASGSSDNSTSISSTELQQWLDRIAGCRHVEDCMSCLDALNSVPASVSEHIWQSAETLMPHFWQVAEIEVPQSSPQLLSEDLETDASPPIQAHPCEQIDGNAAISNPNSSDTATTPVVQSLVTGLWVRTIDGIYGYLSAMLPDGRWWVMSPKTRNSDATSRIYAAADIIPIPNS